tara:strand:- start:4547 stop:4789 length:243 start_codon:yes stop_codon:yes gene_type:complete
MWKPLRLANRIRLELSVVFAALWLAAGLSAEPDRPNIVWINCEDLDETLGCYGDPYAITPNRVNGLLPTPDDPMKRIAAN